MEITSRSYKQLQPEDRVTMASMLQGKSGIREMARALGRSPSTISREIKRNGAVKGYASASAHVRCRVRRQESRPALKIDVEAKQEQGQARSDSGHGEHPCAPARSRGSSVSRSLGG